MNKVDGKKTLRAGEGGGVFCPVALFEKFCKEEPNVNIEHLLNLVYFLCNAIILR